MHRAVAVLLVVDGDAGPTGGAGCLGDVQGMCSPVQRNGLVEQVSARSPLYLDHEMIPGVVLRLARHTGGNPLLSDIAVNVPLMTARYATFVTPNVAPCA